MIRYRLCAILMALVLGRVAVAYASDLGSGVLTKGMDIVINTEKNERKPQRGMGMLLGRVTRGPISPVEGIGDLRPSVPVPGVRILISRSNRQGSQSLVTEVVTDKEGRYGVNLFPGGYRIEIFPLDGNEFTKDLPTTITVTEGDETYLGIHIDTGLR